ncbi:MAG TPA: toll/interleukin-1 receptor domain-containing protein, partial [Acidimicrobiia bacterium]|nr:toll/interleukin-1 receptor domain-containing protein [Acidimicrobiia bacterium]
MPQRDPGQQDLHRVFISYSRSDFYFAEQLAGALRRRGFAVWFDVHELGPGTDWSSAIDRAIAECDTFLVVASRAAMGSPYVQQERDRAVELTRSCIAVLPGRLGPADVPSGAIYDLAGSFGRGVDQIAADLTAGHPQGWRPRLSLPLPVSVLLVALAPVLATLLAVLMATSFARAVAGQLIAFIPNGTWAVAVAVSMIALVGVYSAYCSWAFIMRRSSWLNIRGFQFTMPLIALLVLVTVDTMAGYINEPWIFALGGEAEETYLGDASAVLAVGVVLACALAAVVTSYAAGPCRHLKTGIAPERLRRRHMGPVPGSVETPPPARSYRLIAADDDLPVADEVRSALAA